VPSLPDLVLLVKPDKLQAVYAEVENFVGAYSRRLPEQASTDLVRDLRSLTSRYGPPAEAALRALLCERGSLRHSVEKALDGGVKSALALVVPLLVAQFALAPTVALLVAAFVIKTLATHGQKQLCAELSLPSTRPMELRPPTASPKLSAPPKRRTPVKSKAKAKRPAARPKKKSPRKAR